MRRSVTAIPSAALLALLLTAAPATAIVGGEEDTTSKYPYVGLLEFRADGDWWAYCSGTLIEPDVVLTAAHCAWDVALGWTAASDVRVNFNRAPGRPSDPNDPMAYAVESAVIPEAIVDALASKLPPGVSAKNILAPGWEDIALVYLTESVSGIAPAAVAGPGYLDSLDLKRETFTVAGYGRSGYELGNSISPNGVAIYDGIRRFREVVPLGQDAYPDRYLKVSAGICIGDSGGPLLHDGTVVAINVWGNSLRCGAPSLEYRVDSEAAQAFLSANL